MPELTYEDPLSPSQLQPAGFWICREDTWSMYTASEVMDLVESGVFNLETPIRLEEDGPDKSLRSYIRELVWMSYLDPSHNNDIGKVERSPFRVAFEESHAGMAVSDLGGRIQYVNPALCELLGYEKEELIGKLVSEVSHHEDRQREIELGNELFSGQRNGFQIEKRFLSKSGQWITALMNISLARGSAGEPQSVVASVVDLREWQARQDAKTLQSEMNAMQQIARGVAHDYNNTVTIIKHATHFLSEDLEADNEDILALRGAISVAERLNNQLTTFAQVGMTRQRIDLVQAISAQEPLLRHLLRVGQQISLDLPEGPVHVSLDAQSLEQILYNLVSNASEAMTDSGQVRIVLEPFVDAVSLHVKDDGKGIDDAEIEQIFAPFFTSKASGRGMGLSIVQAAAYRNGFQIRASSELGTGTRITIDMPLTT